MKVDFKSSFVKDLRRVEPVAIRERLGATIELVEQAKDLHDSSSDVGERGCHPARGHEVATVVGSVSGRRG